MKYLAFFVSGSGSNMQAIIDRIKSDDIKALPKLVVASKPNIYAIERAKKLKIPWIITSEYKKNGCISVDDYIIKTLQAHQIDIILLAGYLSIVSKSIVKAYDKRILNIHPSLIPSFSGKGYYGIYVHDAVLKSGVKVTGATVHFVDAGVDTGAIIVQDVYHIQPEDTAESIQKNVLKIEHQIFSVAVKALVDDHIIWDGNRCYIK